GRLPLAALRRRRAAAGRHPVPGIGVRPKHRARACEGRERRTGRIFALLPGRPLLARLWPMRLLRTVGETRGSTRRRYRGIGAGHGIGPGENPGRELSEWPVIITFESQILIGLHILFAAVFVGSNVFLDFLLTPRLDVIPPGQAARLGDKIGVDFAILNFIALGGLPLTALLLLWRLSVIGRLITWQFYGTGYGVALLGMMIIWLSLVVTAAILTFYLRPRVLIKVPFDT